MNYAKIIKYRVEKKDYEKNFQWFYLIPQKL